MATDARKTRLFQVISRAELSERIPRVPGAFHFALPFTADPDVDWVDYLDGTDGTLIAPRAFPVSRYESVMPDPDDPGGSWISNPSEGLVYPTDLDAFSHSVVMPEDPEHTDYAADLALWTSAEAAVDLAKAEFLGIVIDGFDHTKDLNITVTLAAGIPAIYLQGSLDAPSETVDNALRFGPAADLGLKYFNGQVFWNRVQ